MNPNRAPQPESGERRLGIKLIVGGLAICAVAYPFGLEQATALGLITAGTGILVQRGEDKLNHTL